MRVSKIVCDGCGKEIHEKPIAVFAEILDRETGDFTEEGPIYAPKKDFCEECFERIKNFIETMGKEAPAEESEPIEEPEPPVEEPVADPEPMEESVEEPAPVKPPKKPKKESPKDTERVTVKDMILAGASREEVLRKTGCTPATYSQIKYKLKKEGLLSEEAEEGEAPEPATVKCSQVGKRCEYYDRTSDCCDYIGATGNRRGCPPEECDKFKFKVKKK